MTDYDKWAKFEDEDGDEDAPSQQAGIEAVGEEITADLERQRVEALANGDEAAAAKLAQEIEETRRVIASGALGGGGAPPPQPPPDMPPRASCEPAAESEVEPAEPEVLDVVVGSWVRVEGLGKAAQYNESIGRVVEARPDDGRNVVSLFFGGEEKRLALQLKNTIPLSPTAWERVVGKASDVVSSVRKGVNERTKAARQVFGSAKAVIEAAADDALTWPKLIAPKQELLARVAAMDKEAERGVWAPEWPAHLVGEMSELIFRTCATEMALSCGQRRRGDGTPGHKGADGETTALAVRLLDAMELLRRALAVEAAEMIKTGTHEKAEPPPPPPLQVDDQTTATMTVAVFERYAERGGRRGGRMTKACFNKMGSDMERSPNAEQMPQNMWKRLCEDSGTTSEEGFSFGQFRDFWLPGPNRSGNKGGLAQLHAGIYNVNIDSVAKREDWAESLWDSMEYKPGTRVALHSLSGAAEYNGRVGTVLGLHRIKERYVVQLDPLDPREIKHLSLKAVNLAVSEKARQLPF